MTKKILRHAYIITCVLFFLWVGLSWFDIILDNCAAGPLHSNYNIFVLLLEVIGN